MRLRVASFVIATAVLGVMAKPAHSQVPQSRQEFLAPAQAMQLIADGQPWTGLVADGKRATITLNKDGTGSLKGPMPMALSIAWQIKGPDVCLDISIAGTKCLRFRQVAGGFEGWAGNAVDMKLSR